MAIWQRVPNHPDYAVSDQGQVLSYRRSPTVRLMNPSNIRGYLCLDLQPGPTTFRLNRLVLITFIGPPPTPTHHARHLNGDKQDNRLINLAWGTAMENSADMERHGRRAHGESQWKSKLTAAQAVEIYLARGDPFRTRRRLSKEFSVSVSVVDKIQRRLMWARETQGVVQ